MRLTACLTVLAMLTADAAAQTTENPAAPAWAPQQLDDGWRVASPESLGLRPQLLDEITAVLDAGEAFPNRHALLIFKGNSLVYEHYLTGTDRRWVGRERREVTQSFGPDTLHDSRSMAKSFTGALVGLAIQDGAITSVNQPIIDFYPEHSDTVSEATRSLTLEHLLTFSAGLDWNELALPYSDPQEHSARMRRSDDPAGFVLARPITSEPGARWQYNGGQTTLLGIAVSRAVGQHLGQFARERLFQPLGITDVVWGNPNLYADVPELSWPEPVEWADAVVPESSIWLRPRDFAKFGSLYLNQGRWNGEQVLPATWVQQSLRPRINKPDPLIQLGPDLDVVRSYGYQWHHDTFRTPEGQLNVPAASGHGGQRIYLVPQLDLLVVQTTGQYGKRGTDFQTMKLLVDYILPWARGEFEPTNRMIEWTVFAEDLDNWPVADLGAADLEPLLGRYRFDDTVLEARLVEGHLEIAPVLGPGDSVSLVALKDGSFAIGRYNDGELLRITHPEDRFEFEQADGAVTALINRDTEGTVFMNAERIADPEP